MKHALEKAQDILASKMTKALNELDFGCKNEFGVLPPQDLVREEAVYYVDPVVSSPAANDFLLCRCFVRKNEDGNCEAVFCLRSDFNDLQSPESARFWSSWAPVQTITIEDVVLAALEQAERLGLA